VRYDELVKDPICNTYVARSRAVTRHDATGLHYFCSSECARRYARLG
jgi:YHS domain-containing protein